MDKELFEKTLKMPPDERLAFAELLLASLEHEDQEIRAAWVSEVNERIKAVNEGRANLLDFEALNDAD